MKTRSMLLSSLLTCAVLIGPAATAIADAAETAREEPAAAPAAAAAGTEAPTPPPQPAAAPKPEEIPPAPEPSPQPSPEPAAAPDGQTPAAAAAAAVADGAEAKGDARDFVRDLYRKLATGSEDAYLPLASALDVEAVLAHALAGLSAEPPAEWRAAALARLEADREKLARAMADTAGPAMVRTLPALAGPDGTTLVAVRLYVFSQYGFRTSWHRVTLARKGNAWQIAEIEIVESSDLLSNIALSALGNPKEKPLPKGSSARALAAPAVQLVVCIGLGVALGLVLRRALRGSGNGAGGSGGAGGGGWILLGTVAGLALGLVFFGAGMIWLLSERGAVDEFDQRCRSMALLQEGNVDGALKLWRENRTAQTVRATPLEGRAGPEAAESYVAAMAGTPAPPPAVYLQLARLRGKSRQWREAAASRLTLSKLLGGDALLATQAACDLVYAGDSRGADELLREAAQDEPPDFQILMFRSQAHAAMRNAPATIADLRALLATRESPFDPRQIAALVEQSGDYKAVRNDPAFKAFIQGLKSGPDDAPVGPVRR